MCFFTDFSYTLGLWICKYCVVFETPAVWVLRLLEMIALFHPTNASRTKNEIEKTFFVSVSGPIAFE